MTEEESLEHLTMLLKDLEELDANEEFVLQEEVKFDTIEALKILLKENQNLKETLKTVKDELIGDRMEQFDDYVIYLQDKYLKLLGEEE